MSRHNKEYDYRSSATYNEQGQCTHNNRCRYTHGYHCEDCNTFISKDSDYFRKHDLLNQYSMVLHNINAERGQKGLVYITAVKELQNLIDSKDVHDNYEQLIALAEAMVAQYGKTKDSATVTLR